MIKICKDNQSDESLFYTICNIFNDEIFSNVNEVIIEIQPALKNPRMKTIQVFIQSYFYMEKTKKFLKLNNIHLFPALKKLDSLLPYFNIKFIKESNNNDENKDNNYDNKDNNYDNNDETKNNNNVNNNENNNEINYCYDNNNNDNNNLNNNNNNDNQSLNQNLNNTPEIFYNDKLYKDRKKMSVFLTKKYLQTNQTLLAYFNEHPKKDDLADSLMQGITFLQKKFKIKSL